jgi:hypothetical protein
MNKILLGMAAASAMVFASSAMAIPTILVGFDSDNDNTFETIVADNATGDVAVGVGSIVAAIDSFSKINAGSFVENPFSMHMSITHTGAGTRTYATTVVGLTLADISSAVFDASNGTGSITDVYETWGYFDSGDIQFGKENLIGTSGPQGLGFTFDSSQYLITDTDEFSLTLITKITTTNATPAMVGSRIQVSEPSVLALFGLGLIGLGGVASRRKKA